MAKALTKIDNIIELIDDMITTNMDKYDKDDTLSIEFDYCDIKELYNALQGICVQLVFGKVKTLRRINCVDLRDRFMYNESHIISAINYTNKDDIIKTMLKQNDEILYCYGDSTTLQSKNIIRALNDIQSHPNCKSIKFLNIKYKKFQKKFPLLCINNTETDKLLSYPNIILDDRLYLSNAETMENETIINNTQITHIVTVANESFKYPKTIKKQNILQIHIHDTRSACISQYFSKCFNFINSAFNSNPNNKVLIHCKHGVSRSATIIIGYVMKYHNKTLWESYNFVKNCRDIIHPNFGFFTQLCQFESDILNISTKHFFKNIYNIP